MDESRWKAVLASGIDALMIREPLLDPRELLVIARWARDSAPDVMIWVNGRLDVAVAARCGFHAPEAYPAVPRGFLPPLSMPVHDPAQIPSRAHSQQLILSPVYAVPGKGPAWGPERLHQVLDQMPPLKARVLALGGITPGNAAALKHPRLDGVALIRGLWTSPDPAQCVASLREAWHPGYRDSLQGKGRA